MKILITGGAGFIGFNLLKRLERVYPESQIYILDNLSSKTANHTFLSKKISFIKDDLKNLKKYQYLQKVDLIFHLAAKGNVVDSIEDPRENFDSNVSETLNLLEFMRENKIKNLIFSSTGGAIMGNSKPPVNEEKLPAPISPYGASKLACEGYLRAYSESYNMNCICFRFGNVFGPFSLHKKGVINLFIKAFKNDRDIKIYGDGSSSRDYIYVEDIVAGLIKGMEFILKREEKSFFLFHLSSGIETSLNELIKTLEKISNKTIHVKKMPFRTGEVNNNFADFTLAKNLLNFKPEVSLESGLKILYKLI